MPDNELASLAALCRAHEAIGVLAASEHAKLNGGDVVIVTVQTMENCIAALRGGLAVATTPRLEVPHA